MSLTPINYKKWIEDKLAIVDKSGSSVPFMLNSVQDDILAHLTQRDIILKARQMGVSSLLLAIFFCDFLLIENSYSVVMADNDENATALLARVKYFKEAYEDKNDIQIPLKYNSKSELFNPVMNTTFKIGSAKNIQFGRSRTLTNLHLSELAFYPNIEALFASALQAVVPEGRVIVETTANGFNQFKSLWDDAHVRGFTIHFYSPEWLYDSVFLNKKKAELGRLFDQEYPTCAETAFLTSGDVFFSREALREYMKGTISPLAFSI